MEVLILMIIVFYIIWLIIKLTFKLIIWIVEIIFNIVNSINNSIKTKTNNSKENSFNFDTAFILLTILGLFNLADFISSLLTSNFDGCMFFGILSILLLYSPIKRIICYLKSKNNNLITTTTNIKNTNNLDNNKTITNINTNIESNIYNTNYIYDSSIIDNKIERFKFCLNTANQQTTKEILEVLFDFDDLDKAYIDIKKLKPNFISRNAYEETKLNILDYIINDKFSKYCSNKNKQKEKLKALLDELYVCKRRYPEYKEIFEKYILNIKQIIITD